MTWHVALKSGTHLQKKMPLSHRQLLTQDTEELFELNSN